MNVEKKTRADIIEREKEMPARGEEEIDLCTSDIIFEDEVVRGIPIGHHEVRIQGRLIIPKERDKEVTLEIIKSWLVKG